MYAKLRNLGPSRTSVVRGASPLWNPAWKSFVQSMALLTVAMLAALYSSSAGRDGRVAAAGIAAIFALALAVWVCWRFVPKLAQGVEWDWLPFMSSYNVTREGWLYLGGIAIVIFAAINTANNLLYMVLSALLAVLLLSGFLSSLNFRFITIDLQLPPRCFAGQSFPFSLEIRNVKRVFPTFSLHLPPPPECPVQWDAFYFPVVEPQNATLQFGDAVFPRRGRYAIRELTATSRYPFGFLSRERTYDVEAECVCYPEIFEYEDMNFSALDIQGVSQPFERGLGQDLYTIRDYLPVDSARHVHWKASAKTATLKTREYAAEESRRFLLALDRFGQPDDTERFEWIVSYAASLALHLMRDGAEVALVTDEWQTPFGTSDALLDSILNYLAVVEMSSNVGLPDADPDSGAVLLSLRPGRG